MVEVVLQSHKANPHHHSHSLANSSFKMYKEKWNSYLQRNFQFFLFMILRRIINKQIERTDSRRETNWRTLNFVNHIL